MNIVLLSAVNEHSHITSKFNSPFLCQFQLQVSFPIPAGEGSSRLEMLKLLSGNETIVILLPPSSVKRAVTTVVTTAVFAVVIAAVFAAVIAAVTVLISLFILIHHHRFFHI